MSYSLVKLRASSFRTVVHNKYIEAEPPFELKTKDYFVCITRHDREPNFLAVYCDVFNQNLLEANYKCTILYCGDKNACINELESGRNSSVPERFLVSWTYT